MKDRVIELLKGLKDGRVDEVPIGEAIRMIRREYTYGGLIESEIAADPMEQFERWFHDAVRAGVADANAMSLATASHDNVPSVRIVLLKSTDKRGFVFYTHFESRKARELEQNAKASLLFYWHALDRQVRIEGRAERTSEEESAAYFASRPRESRLAAWASAQSQTISDRPVLEARLEEIRLRFANGDVPLPPFWGGYRIVPNAFEFWQGRINRLHDRIVYRRQNDGWQRERLCP